MVVSGLLRRLSFRILKLGALLDRLRRKGSARTVIVRVYSFPSRPYRSFEDCPS